MIEVFKTNVSQRAHADRILAEIHRRETRYAANFDLDDCDRILRVKALTGQVQCEPIIEVVRELGFTAVALE